jgi:O-antigen/teichoic acid export membrane protein
MLLNFLLIPTFDILGAAISTAISMSILLLLKIYLSKDTPETKQIILLKFIPFKRQ